MRQKILDLWSNQIIKGTTLFFLGSMVVSFGGFLYHLVLARTLGPSEYGALAALLGLLYLLNIPMGTLDLFITKMVSSFEEKNAYSHTKSFISFLLTILFKSTFIFFPILLLFSKIVQDFLHLENVWGVIFTWTAAVIWLYTGVFRSLLKGLLKFSDLVANQIIDMSARLILSLGIVMFISKTYIGAQIGTLLASLVGLMVVIFQLKPVFSTKSSKFEHHKWPIKSLGWTSFLLAASYSTMYSIDIILVKHYFPLHIAGIYGALSTASKIIFFAEAPIGSALLPVVARKAGHPSQARWDLLLLLFLISTVGIGIVGIYFFMPNLIIKTIFTDKFIDAAPYLPWIGIALFFYSLAGIFANFLLALGKMKSAYAGVVALLVEIILLTVFHSSLWQVIASLTSVFGILAVILLIYSLHVTRQR